MATTVKRGAGRPAAYAKRKKHAQRTALPPRGRSGVAGGGTTAKVLADERSQKQALSPAAAKSMVKAEECAAIARANGYSTETEFDGSLVKVIATKVHKDRTEEVVEVTFIDGKMSQEFKPCVHISPAGAPQRTVLLRNASAFKMQVSGKPRKPVPLHVKALRSRRADDLEEDSGRPFDENATELVLLEAFRGAQIWWRNGHAGGRLETGHVPADAKRGRNYRITDHPQKTGERILHFIDAQRGQSRAVSLSKIMRVVK